MKKTSYTHTEPCIFCKIIKGNILAEKLFEDDIMIIIRDIDPKAKTHYLAIPKNPYSLFDEMETNDKNNLGHIFSTIAKEKDNLGLQDGYRLVINQGSNAGQSVFHLHIHILGGQQLSWADYR